MGYRLKVQGKANNEGDVTCALSVSEICMLQGSSFFRTRNMIRVIPASGRGLSFLYLDLPWDNTISSQGIFPVVLGLETLAGFCCQLQFDLQVNLNHVQRNKSLAITM